MTIKEIRSIKTEELEGYIFDYGTHKKSTIDLNGNEVLQALQGYTDEEGVTHAPIVPEPAYTVEERKEYLLNKKIDELKQARTNEISSPFNNVDVDSPEDRENIQGVLQAFEMLYPDGVVTWTMADNTEQEMTKADLEAVVSGYIARKAQAFAKYQTLKEQARLANTVEELEAITW